MNLRYYQESLGDKIGLLIDERFERRRVEKPL